MKNRPARVRELIQRELGAIIGRELTFRATLVTIHGVDLTPDFRHCHVFIGVLGTAPQQREALVKLNENRQVLQRELSKRVILKFTPQLHFRFDESVERGTKVMEIMRQIDDITPPEVVLGEDDDENAFDREANLVGEDENVVDDDPRPSGEKGSAAS